PADPGPLAGLDAVGAVDLWHRVHAGARTGGHVIDVLHRPSVVALIAVAHQATVRGGRRVQAPVGAPDEAVDPVAAPVRWRPGGFTVQATAHGHPAVVGLRGDPLDEPGPR